MRTKQPISFRLRTGLFIAAAFTVLLSVFFIASYLSIERTLVVRSDAEVTAALDAILSALHEPPTQAVFDSLYRSHSTTGESAIAISLRHSDGSHTGILARGPSHAVAILDSVHLSLLDPPQIVHGFEHSYRIISRVARPHALVGAIDMLPLDEVQDTMISQFLFLLGVGVIVSFVIGMITANLALKPLKVLISSAFRIRSHSQQHDALPTDTRTAEINELASLINDVLAERNRNIEALRTFTADAAHELRTPLTILKGEMEVDLRTKEFTLSDRAAIESNLEEVARLIRIVEDLLTLARLDRDTHTQDHASSPWSPNELLDETLGRFVLVADEKRLAVVRDLQSTHNCTIHREDVRTIVANLIDNAIRYTPEGGSLTVRSFDAPDGSSVIEISDTGIGIAASDLPYIFDRFWRADRARTRSAGGTGLGLTIAKRLADLHHIALEVESESGRGTIVRCRIPTNRRP
ncbi:MAG: hypothetical protein JSS75_04050 [Bacteroidetes bacterium]|nr:hypothetical protein [Bacteroidota bacterium]